MTLFRTIGAAVVVLSVGAGTGLAFLAGCAYQPDEAKTVAEPRALCGPSEEMAFGLVDKFESVPIGIGNAGGARDFLLIGPSVWLVMQVRDDKTACVVSAGKLLPKVRR